MRGTTGDNDPCIRVFPLEPPYGLAGLAFRFRRHGAGIDDNGTGTAITIDASNNVSMSGDLTVTGDLTVSGDSVVINTSTLSVEDPLTVLSSGATGSAAVDAGFVVERGDDTNVAWLWDESADQFTFVTTAETGSTAGDVTITDYANVRAGSLTLDDNLTVNGGTVTLGTGTDLNLLDNNAAALSIQEGANQYMSFITTDGGEKITIGKAKTIQNTDGVNNHYLHTVVKDNVAKLAVMVSLDTKDNSETVKTFSKQLSMHIAASKVPGFKAGKGLKDKVKYS